MALINVHNFCNIPKKKCESPADISDMNSNKRAIQHENTHGECCVSLKWKNCCGTHPYALVSVASYFSILPTRSVLARLNGCQIRIFLYC